MDLKERGKKAFKPFTKKGGKEPSGPPTPGRDLWNNALTTIFIFLVLMTIYSFLADGKNKSDIIPISEVAADITRGDVASITVSGESLEVTYEKGGIVRTARKEGGVALTETLANYGVPAEVLQKVKIEVKDESGFTFWFLNLAPFLIPILFILGFIWFLSRQVKGAGMQAFSFGQSKPRIIFPTDKKQKVTFKDVAGVKEAKDELKEIVDFLKNPKKFLDIGAQIPKGVLLMGASGTGKTLLARAVAGAAGVAFFSISGSEFVEMFVGVGASRVRDLFQMAKRAAPAIIFVDEIDAVGRTRGGGVGGGNDEREQTLNQILVEMDGFEQHEKVIVLAASNRPDVLDPALVRPGRFDRMVVVDLPDRNDREAILQVHALKKHLGEDVNLRVVAERTPGFSGADLYSIVNEAAILAARENRTRLAQFDLIRSIEKVMLGPERKSHLLSQEEKKITAYHEAGHALVSSVLPYADPVHKVSIIARGRAAGYTMKLPSEDRHLYTRSYFLDELASALGGYAAEKLVFNELTTGPHDDLKKATDLARSLVTRFGMSDKVGPMTFGEQEEMIFLGRELGTSRNYSEETARMIDGEIKRLMDEAFERAKKVLTRRRETLDAIAAVLIEKETIEREAFNTIVKEKV